jgi:peptidoglycan/LPS O-acetylase OafA/YrhL
MDNRIMQVAFPFFMPLLYASVLALCLEIRPGIAATVLTNSFFRIVAKYSYAMYLVHLYFGLLVLVIFRILGQRFPIIDGVLTVLFIPAACAVVFGMAAVSWRYIESPTLRLKDRFFCQGRQSRNKTTVTLPVL